MLKLAANLDWLFTELPMSARFHAARREGFRAVEGMFFCQHSLDMLRIAQQESGMSVVLMNAPAGDWLRGERGLAALPGRDDEYLNSLLIARRYAGTLGCRQVHVMAGLRDHSVTEDEQLELLVNRLCIACDVLAEKDITVLIEPLNSEDMPGYIINSLPRAKDIIRRVSHQNIGLQFDIYHCQKIHGNV
ncbi:hydroxypyruvate isomerase family protein, partial [Escherichia coli]